MPVRMHKTVTPTEADAQQARESLQQINRILKTDASNQSFCVQSEQPLDEPIAIPAFALRLLKVILTEMAEGHAVAILPLHAELTTQQTADLLQVSRPYLIGLLEERKIPFRLVGQHRRVRLDDLLAYRRKDNEDRSRIADELAADAQELGMGYG